MHYQTLLNAVNNVSGASFVGLDTLTLVSLRGGKKNPQQGRVTKRMTGASVMVFQNKNINGYEAMIQRRLIAEGRDPTSFELGPRAWGQRLPNLPIVEHNGNYYLEVIFLKAGKVEYFLDGQPIARGDIQGLEEKTEGIQGNLINKVIIRTFSADSITELRVDGQQFN